MTYREGKKPPAEIRPRWYLDQIRKHELERAIYLRMIDEYPIPVEWIVEYNEILERRERHV